MSTKNDALVFVHVQELYGGLSDFRDSDNLGAYHGKMVLPAVKPRIEQCNDAVSRRRNRSHVWPLFGIAIGTSKRQIRWIVSTAVLSSSNVLNVEREIGRGVLWQATVFASVIGPSTHEIS